MRRMHLNYFVQNIKNVNLYKNIIIHTKYKMKRNISEISTNLRQYEINTPQYNLYKICI